MPVNTGLKAALSAKPKNSLAKIETFHALRGRLSMPILAPSRQFNSANDTYLYIQPGSADIIPSPLDMRRTSSAIVVSGAPPDYQLSVADTASVSE
jgi:hypothetical protein